jgi:hypothetical protein
MGHELQQGRTQEAAAVYRRLLVAAGGDSTGAREMERRLRDPALRRAAVREIEQGADPAVAIAMYRAFDGDEATISYVAGLAGSERRESLNKDGLFMLLSPRLRASPRMQAALARLGYPPPDVEGAGR